MESSGKRPTVSAVIITLNEEANIGPCLESVRWADEIVVLDSGSTDRTVEICRTFTDRVRVRPWSGYASQRNAAHDLATGDWILSLDADERVTEALASEIKDLLDRGPGDKVGYYLPYKVFYGDKWLRHGGFFPERHLRFFCRGRGHYGSREVHEALKVDGPVGSLNHHVLHYSYTSVSDFMDRLDRYSTLSAREYHVQGRKTGPFRMLGHAGFTFFQMYLLKRGFLDGYEGFLMASLYSVYTLVKYAKLYELNRSRN